MRQAILTQIQKIAADGTSATVTYNIGHGITKVVDLSVVVNTPQLVSVEVYFDDANAQYAGHLRFYLGGGYSKRYAPYKIPREKLLLGSGTLTVSTLGINHQAIVDATFLKMSENEVLLI